MRERYHKLIPSTWQKLMVLGQKQGAMKLKDLAQEIGLGEEETIAFIRELFPSGGGLEIYQQQQECWVDIDAESLQYMLPLTPGEWMELYRVLQLAQTQLPPAEQFKSLKRKVLENGPVNLMMDLLQHLEQWDEKLTEQQQAMLKQLEAAAQEKTCLRLTTNEHKSYRLYCLKILHLEGQLSLIAEDAQDHCLMVLPLREMLALEALESGSGSRVSPYEIEEFIAAIRAMSERETRLILKIHDPQSVNLFPNYHFLGKPCMITNPEGDLIWAAYVEPCDGLFEWLIELDTNVEILDPLTFKEQYLAYCKEKLRKIA
jgi:hypothetical protein